MSETKHSPEPWFGYDGSHFAATIGGKALWVGKTSLNADARRIVAAINAVSGIPTEALESGALEKALEAAAIYSDPSEPASCRRLAWEPLHAALGSLGRLR